MKQLGFAPILILISVLVLSAVVGGAYYLSTQKSSTYAPAQHLQEIVDANNSISQKSASPQSTNTLLPIVTENNETLTPETTKKTLPVDETANWKMYTNSNYGFLVKYPSERILGEEPKAADSEILSSRLIYIQEKDNFNSGTVNISVYSDGAGSIESWEGLAGIKATNIAVGQELANTVEWIDKTTSGKSLYNQKIVINKNNLNYVISSNIYNDSIQKENFLKTFNQILSTFRFDSLP